MGNNRMPPKDKKNPSPRVAQSDKAPGKAGSARDPHSLSLGHISERQVTAIMAFLLGLKALLITPTFLILDLATSAWMGVLISIAIAIAGLAGWLKWSRLTSGMAFSTALQKTLGKVLGTIVCAGIVTSLVVSVSLSMRLFAGGAVVGLLPEFPIEVILFILISVSAYAAWLGIEGIARAATFFLLPTLISFAVVVLTGIRGHDARNLFPLFGAGPVAVIKEGAKQTGLWGVMPAFAALKPYVRAEKDLGRGAQKGLLLAGIGLAASVVSILMFFSYPVSTRLAHPMGILARAVYMGRYLQRIEAVFVFTWFFGSAIQASFTYFVLLSLLAEVSGTKTYRPLLPALTLLSFGIGALPNSILRAGQLLETYFFDSTGLALVALGWVLFAVAKARGLEAHPDRRKEAGGGDRGAEDAQGNRPKASPREN